MRTFEKWDQLENKNCRIIINHILFGENQYDCDMLQIINDEHRVGVVIKGKDLFVNKLDVLEFEVRDDIYMVKDKMLTITIVNKM